MTIVWQTIVWQGNEPFAQGMPEAPSNSMLLFSASVVCVCFCIPLCTGQKQVTRLTKHITGHWPLTYMQSTARTRRVKRWPSCLTIISFVKVNTNINKEWCSDWSAPPSNKQHKATSVAVSRIIFHSKPVDFRSSGSQHWYSEGITVEAHSYTPFSYPPKKTRNLDMHTMFKNGYF